MTEIHIKLNPDWKNPESLIGLIKSLELKGHIEYLTPTNNLLDAIGDDVQKYFQEFWDHLFEVGLIAKDTKITTGTKKDGYNM